MSDIPVKVALSLGPARRGPAPVVMGVCVSKDGIVCPVNSAAGCCGSGS